MGRITQLQEGIWRLGARGGIVLMVLVAFAFGYLLCAVTSRTAAAPLFGTSPVGCCFAGD